MDGDTELTTFLTTRKSESWAQAERASRLCKALASDPSLSRLQPLLTALTPSDERYLYACFIAALSTLVSQRSSSTDENGTTTRRLSEPVRYTTGQATPPTPSDT